MSKIIYINASKVAIAAKIFGEPFEQKLMFERIIEYLKPPPTPPEPEPEPESESESESDSKNESQSDSSDSESNTGSDTESDTDSESESDSENDHFLAYKRIHKEIEENHINDIKVIADEKSNTITEDDTITTTATIIDESSSSSVVVSSSITQLQQQILNKLDHINSRDIDQVKSIINQRINMQIGVKMEQKNLNLMEKNTNYSIDNRNLYIKYKSIDTGSNGYIIRIGGRLDGITRQSNGETVIVESKNRSRPLKNNLTTYDVVQMHIYMWLYDIKTCILNENYKDHHKETTIKFNENTFNSIKQSLIYSIKENVLSSSELGGGPGSGSQSGGDRQFLETNDDHLFANIDLDAIVNKRNEDNILANLDLDTIINEHNNKKQRLT